MEYLGKRNELLRKKNLGNEKFSNLIFDSIQKETINAIDIHHLTGHHGSPTEEEKVLVHALRETSKDELHHWYSSEDQDCVRTEVFLCFYRSEKLFSVYESIFNVNLRIIADDLVDSFYNVYETLYEFRNFIENDELENSADEFINY